MMEYIEKLLNYISGWMWGPPMLALLLGTHLFFTFRLRFIQLHIVKGIRISLQINKEAAGDISQFGALVTALAATIGTGNIVGVATAVSLGGPGAVLWMWLTGVFGIATKYAEALLSVSYRVKLEDGSMAGGPMYVLERGLKNRKLGIAFAVFTAIAAFGIGNMVQANSISTMLSHSYGVPQWASGSFMTVVAGVVIIGGIRSIARFCSWLVPFMAVFYVAGCVVLIIAGWQTIPDTLALIASSAFNGQAALGGFAGAGVREAMRYGLARGLFSNESGLGSAPIVAAAAQTKNPVRQALVSSTGTFWDTVVICAMTGIVIVNSGAWKEGLEGAALTQRAFSAIPAVGPLILSVGLLTFVFSTILGWSYYGEKAVEYLFGIKSVALYRVAWVAAVMAGSVASLPSVWAFADITNALMAIPNLISLILLHKVVAAKTKYYLWEGRLEEQMAE